MTAIPKTRHSLILRLPTQSDVKAWREFVEIYEPLLLRFALRHGLQDADAREVAQNVFISVAKSVEKWQPDRGRGRFRDWLFKIAKNHLINYLVGTKRKRGAGTTDQIQLLNMIPGRTHEAEQLLTDYRREMFRLAAALAKQSFQPVTWEAFWRTAVMGLSVDEVLGDLGISRTAVYIARSRVTARLKEIIQQWEQDDVL